MELNDNINDWEEIKGESNIWIPSKIGESVEGIIISMEKKQFGLSVVIEDKEHKSIMLPSHKVLQNRIVNCKIGDMIKVVYEKEELPKVRGQNPTKIYKVLTKKI